MAGFFSKLFGKKDSTPNDNLTANLEAYFYKPVRLFNYSSGADAVSYCDSNYDSIHKLLDTEKALSLLLLMYFHHIGYNHVSSSRFSVSDAKEKKEEARNILTSYLSNESGSHTGPWYFAYCAINAEKMDRKKQEEYLEKGGSLGCSQAYYEYAQLFNPNHGPSRSRNYSPVDEGNIKYFEYLNKTLKLCPTHAGALNDLGTAYFNGQGVPIDTKKGIEYFEKAAENGSLFALYNLGTSYQETKAIKCTHYLVKYSEKSLDPDGIKACFNLCRVVANKSHNPFDLMHVYLICRVLLNYRRFFDTHDILQFFVFYLSSHPKLLRLIETMVDHSDEIYSFDVGGIVNNEIVARTRHYQQETANLFADYFNGHSLSYDEAEDNRLRKVFDKMFEPLDINDLDKNVELYDKAIYAIGISRVAETEYMDEHFDKTE